MITIARLDVRRLRALFRRRTLDIAPRRPAPPIVLAADPWTGLRIRHQQAHLALEYALPGVRPTSPESIALPFDAFADFDGCDASGVTLDALAPGQIVARWVERGVPVTRDYSLPDLADLPPFPAAPAEVSPCPSGLLDALAEAAGVAGEDTPRYALASIQLRGAGSVVATDGRQLLIHHGFAFPWDDDPIVRPSRLFALPELPRDRPTLIGRTDTHLVVRVGAFTIWLSRRPDVHYPRVDGIIPSIGPRTTRLPGGDKTGGPITLDLNGVIAVRAQGRGDDHPTELVLARSTYTGDPVRIATDRSYLARALTLGLGEVVVSGPDSVISGHQGSVSFAWQPLERDAAIGPDSDALRIHSTHAVTPPPSPSPDRRIDVNTTNPTPSPIAARREVGDASIPATGSISLIEEAEALHAALTEARARSGRLLVALRRQRRSNRLVAETLRSLEGLRDAAG